MVALQVTGSNQQPCTVSTTEHVDCNMTRTLMYKLQQSFNIYTHILVRQRLMMHSTCLKPKLLTVGLKQVEHLLLTDAGAA